MCVCGVCVCVCVCGVWVGGGLLLLLLLLLKGCDKRASINVELHRAIAYVFNCIF